MPRLTLSALLSMHARRGSTLAKPLPATARAQARVGRTVRWALVAACAAAASCSPTSTPDAAPGAATPAPAPYTAHDRELDLASFDVVWTTIRDKHWDPSLGGIDWQAVHDELRPKVEHADSRNAARAAMSEMVHRLKQSHFNIVPAAAYESDEPDQPGDEAPVTNDTAKAPAAASGGDTPAVAAAPTKKRSPGEGATGIDLRILDGKPVVTRVTPGSPAQAAGVQTGWIISKVGGSPTDARLSRVAKAYAESSMQEYYLAATILAELSGGIGDDLEIEFIDSTNQAVTRTMKLGPLEGTAARFGNLPTIYVSFDSHRLPQNIHYFRFSMFFDPPRLTQQIGDAVKGAADTDGFIIDLRGNPGGIGGLAAGVAGWFVSEPNLKLGTMYTRGGSLNFNVNPRLSGYRGPLAVLIDGMSASTSEVLAGGLKDLKRARLFGTRSAGAALPSVFEVLPNQDRFQYAVANYISTSGQTLEAEGVTPDEMVTLDRPSLLAGQDRVLDAAIAWIQAQKPATKPVSDGSK